MTKRILALALIFAGTNTMAATTTTSLYNVLVKKGSYYSIQYVRIGSESAAVNAKVNAAIRSDLIVDQEPCDGTTKNSDFEGSVGVVTLIPGKLLSFNASSSAACEHSAHPSSGTVGENYDLKTGAQLKLDSQINEAGLAALGDLLTKQGRSEHTDAGDDCVTNIYDQGGLQASDFSFAGDSIIVWSDSGHAAQACDTQVTVKLWSLLKFLKPGSISARIANQNL